MSSNETCFHKHSEKESPPLIQNGKVVFQTHHIGWIVTGAFAFLATAISFWLVNKHLRHYTNKHEQRYIVRILFMVPIYSLVSSASYLFWDQSTPLLLIRDCYESTVLTSFFYLLLLYLSPDRDEQRTIFLKVGLSKENDRKAILRGERIQKWIFPLGSVKSKPGDGLYFLQMMKWGVLQYCVIRPATTLVAVILDYVGLYCEDSWSPGWGHVYIVVIVSISVSIAMYCLIQVYVPISKHLAPHRPLLKLFAIKAVVFLTFWQATFLSVLSSLGVVKDTPYMTADDINIGIGAILETVEMTIFAILHIKAFSYKPYVRSPSSSNPGTRKVEDFDREDVMRTPRMRSLLHAFDFRETIRELWDGCIYIIRRWKGVETDTAARRRVIREDLFGSGSSAGPRGNHRSHGHLRRNADSGGNEDDKVYQPVAVTIDVEKEVHVDSERRWLGIDDDYLYRHGVSRNERSAGLAEQIEVELERRGLSLSTRFPEEFNNGQAEEHYSKQDRKQRSWWRRALDRISRTSLDERGGSTEYEVSSAQRASHQIQRATTSEKKYDALPVAIAEEEAEVDEGIISPSLPQAQAFENQHQYRNSPTSAHLHPFPVFVPSITISPSSESTPSDVNHHSSPNLSSAASHDAVLSRLFVNKPASEASGPSSQTHLSSREHHVRLTSPAAIVPTEHPRVLEHMPMTVHASTSEQGSAARPTTKTSESRRMEWSSRGRAEGTENELAFHSRPSRHRRERADYQRSQDPVLFMNRRGSSRMPQSRSARRQWSARTQGDLDPGIHIPTTLQRSFCDDPATPSFQPSSDRENAVRRTQPRLDQMSIRPSCERYPWILNSSPSAGRS